MHVHKRRIFIGNLPPNIEEDYIKNKFSKYGNIISIELKNRKNDPTQNASAIFAFITIETDANNLNNCFYEIPKNNWEGYKIKLELAKESFLERLKREREEEKAKLTKSEQKTSQQNFISTPVNVSSANKKIYYNNLDESEDDTKVSINGTNETTNIPTNFDDLDCKIIDKSPKKEIKTEDELVIKDNRYKLFVNNKFIIESIATNSNKLQDDEPKNQNHKSSVADEKRKKSFQLMKESYHKQKNAIKNALSNIDSKSKSNKIIFNDGEQVTNKRKFNDNSNERTPKKNQLSLFPDEPDENDINFETKNQFEGKQGHKLFKLQSRYTNDTRFTLDSRFADDDYEEDEMNFDDDEKRKQFEILETVLGKKVSKQNEKNKNIPQGMLRFDPTKPEHSKFEIKHNSEKPSKKDKKKMRQENLQQNNIEANIEVSKEKFYKVDDSLKKSLKEKEEFSLLKMFGQPEEEEEKDNNEEEEKMQKIVQNKFNVTQNQFFSDIPDTEEVEEKKTSEIENKFDEKRNYNNKFRAFHGEDLFFKLNDKRLKDGLRFLKKFNETQGTKDFSETRREIKQIMRFKMRQVEKKKKPFFRKIAKNKKIKRKQS